MMSREEHDESVILYHSYPNYTYYVQSPSTTTTTTHINTAAAVEGIDMDPPHLLLSRYSSSRGSNNSFSFTDVKKTSGTTIFNDHDHQFDVRKGVENRLIIVDLNRKDGGGDDEEEEEGYRPPTRGCWWRYFSLRRSNSSSVWIFLQVFWRVLVSFGLALLVFYIATKPPQPKIDIKIASIHQFVLAEGVDATGVTTEVLNCNISISVEVDNKSKLFNLHIRPPLMELSYGRLPFALSHGPKLNVAPYDIEKFQLYVGTKNIPMYGAGRNMQDMLESSKGLSIIVCGSLKFEFFVVWNFIKPKFQHQFQCVVLLGSKYDKKHQTLAYESDCTVS